VDGLERDLDGQATVIKIDFLGSLGRELAPRYGVNVLPSLLLFDRNGQVVARQGGMVDADAMRLAVAALEEHDD